MRNVVQFISILLVAVLIAVLYMWNEWSKATKPPHKDLGGNGGSSSTSPKRPVVDVSPSFSHFRESLYGDDRRLHWGLIYTLAELSNIAYENSDEQIVRAKRLGAKEVTPLANNDSEGFVAADESTVVIAFRGTQDLRDVVTDVLGFPRFLDGGAVHHGFNRAVENIYGDAVRAAIKHGAATKTLFVTGHSLGGALACGFSMRATRKSDLHTAGVVTFGQPLVMSESLCQFMLDEYQDRYVRIVNGVDPITTLVRSYRHAGARARLRDDGEYDWRVPLIATTAAPPGRGKPPAPSIVVEEEIPELQPISEADARRLQRRIREAEPPAPTASGPPQAVGAIFTNPIADHLMRSYLLQIHEIARTRQAGDK